MITAGRGFFFLFLLCIFGASDIAARAADAEGAPASVPDESIARLLDVADTDIDMRFIRTRMQENLEKGRDTLPEESLAVIDQALATAFAPARLRRLVHRSIAANADPALFPAILAWHEGALARRIVVEKNKIKTPAGDDAMKAWRNRPTGAPLDARRLSLLYELDRLTEGSANTQRILDDFHLAYEQALAFYKPDRRLLSSLLSGMVSDTALVEKRQKKVAKRIALHKALTRQRTVLAAAYVLRPFSNAELEQIVAFYETPAGQHWAKLDNQAGRDLWNDVNRHHLALQMGQPIGKLDPP